MADGSVSAALFPPSALSATTIYRHDARPQPGPFASPATVPDHAWVLRPSICLCFCAALPLVLAGCSGRVNEVQASSGLAQGTTYTIQWWSERAVNRAALEAALTEELEVVDELLSNYRPDSAIEQFNAAHSTARTSLPPELVRLLRIASEVHGASGGCFDPTVRPLVRLWGFDGDEPHVPAPSDVAALRGRLGLDKLAIVDDTTVQRSVPELELDMSSIGQGYTVARLARVVEGFGIHDYLVEIGGELAARGSKPDGVAWRIGIEDPTPDGGVAEPLTMPTDRTTAVITSGTYRHFFEDGDRAYSHILDPRTAAPVDHELLAVTVIGPDPTLAATWATALLCLGPAEGMTTADREGIAAVLAVRTDDGVERLHTARFAADWAGSTP